jgi:hypothetical protein
VRFFNTGEQIESGQVVLPEATSGEGSRIKRWVRHSPGLVAGFGCAVLVVVGFLIGSGHGRSEPAATEEGPAVAVPGIERAAAAAEKPAVNAAAAPAAPEPAQVQEAPAQAAAPPAEAAPAPVTVQQLRAGRPAAKPARVAAPHKQSRRPLPHSPRR